MQTFMDTLLFVNFLLIMGVTTAVGLAMLVIMIQDILGK